jgi:hypothetical protein
LCGLAQQKKFSFMNWTLYDAINGPYCSYIQEDKQTVTIVLSIADEKDDDHL